MKRKYLIVLAGSPRGGEKTWESMYKYLLNNLDADLAICCGKDINDQSSLYKNAKYKSDRYNNFRTYLLGGIKYGMDIASQKDIDDEGQKLVKLKRNDLGIEIGFGMDFYLEYFKFSPQIKLNYGLLNLLSEDDTIYTKSLTSLTTKHGFFLFLFNRV